jgi:thiol-disulfide isomerase/thioredoxin
MKMSVVRLLPLSLLLAAFACRKEEEEFAAPPGPPPPVSAAFGDLKAGMPAPPLSLKQTLQVPAGTKVSWEALRGKAVVLEFWATWCGPCVAAIPHLNELAQKYAGKPVQFIAITAENEELVAPFLKKKPIRAWIGLDADRATHGAYGVQGIPVTVLVDAQGKLAGFTHPTGLTDKVLDDLLAGRPLARHPTTGGS